jgi:hypothetical protein
LKVVLNFFFGGEITSELETKMVRSSFPKTWKVAMLRLKEKAINEINLISVSHVENRNTIALGTQFKEKMRN